MNDPDTTQRTRTGGPSAAASPTSWTLSLDEARQSWSVALDGVPRLRIPLAGARPYRGGDCRLTGVDFRQEGDHLVAEGTVQLSLGGEASICVRDLVRLDGDALELRRSWWHEEPRTLTGVELAIEALSDGTLEEHFVSGCLYDGNRQASSDRLVPRLDGAALFEEHKCPTPMVHVVCRGSDARRFAIALQPEPCPVVDGHVPDQWWSLGLSATDAGPTLRCVSGRLVVNGEDERIYDAQNHLSPYPDAWVDARPRHVYEKQVRIDLDADPAPAWAWRRPLRRSLAVQPPLTSGEQALIAPSAIEEAIRLKVGYALRRWHDDGQCAGMTWFPRRPEFADRPLSVEYGWVGQNMRLGVALWRWGRRGGDADLQRRGERCAEGWVEAASAALERGQVAPTHYLIGQGWRDTAGGEDGYARPTMETLFELAEFCRRKREAGQPRTEWGRALADALAFYDRPACLGPDGLWPLKWDRDGQAQPGPTVTAGVLMVAAMAEAAALPGGEPWLDRAAEHWERYADFFLGDRPRHPCGSALDSCCEDMESGMFLLIAALRLAAGMRRAGREVEQQLLQQAMQAADWVLSWTYTWDVPLVAGTLLASAGFRARGWSDVSVQNRCCHPFSSAGPMAALAGEVGRFSSVGLSDVSVQNRHLHVYSANAEFLRLSGDVGHEAGAFYEQQARRMLVPVVRMIARPGCRWGMDEDGEQTEQYNQTNYIQHPWDPVCRPRGGIARWFVPWITVWVLSLCLDFLDHETVPTAPNGDLEMDSAQDLKPD